MLITINHEVWNYVLPVLECMHLIFTSSELYHAGLVYKFSMELDQRSSGPRVLIFPLPLQSHVTTTLKFAELFCFANFHITFLNSHFVHNRILRHTDIQSHFTRYPRFHFDTITDGLLDDHPHSGARMLEMFDSRNSAFAQLGLDSWPPITCVVADGIMHFATDIAKEIGLMSISFRTLSASCYWSYFCMPKLIEASELPFKESKMDMMVTSVPGMEAFLRRRDLPGFCRTSNVAADKTLQFVIRQPRQCQS
ncbi:7-deoxyloganetic acid glucosyltransferase [Prunus yedoensis var. nudiflora]|uniref:7-deoxyloganetic acid glucosyltransferase n=1 Tax=Prunus yedoensis var. nudiflora TaxID=2094558 RepID=A0A314YSP0_PRUYE|nr:7-deoxyloganetic acid glucosyltransferase [Prunus yedoensis var. nudiflora]